MLQCASFYGMIILSYCILPRNSCVLQVKGSGKQIEGNGMNDRKYKFIDLFAGAGGLSEGFVAQGSFIPVAHVEMNQHAAETLKTRSNLSRLS